MTDNDRIAAAESFAVPVAALLDDARLLGAADAIAAVTWGVVILAFRILDTPEIQEARADLLRIPPPAVAAPSVSRTAAAMHVGAQLEPGVAGIWDLLALAGIAAGAIADVLLCAVGRADLRHQLARLDAA